MTKKADENEILYCSFCGKSQHEVLKLIAGPSVQICNCCTDFRWRKVISPSVSWFCVLLQRIVSRLIKATKI